MDKKMFRKVNIGLFIIMMILLIFALQSSNVFVALLSVGSYMVLVSFLKTGVRGFLADERQIRVSEKAAEFSFKALMPILLLANIGLFFGGESGRFHYVRALGITLAYITSLAILIYALTYWYFDRKTRG